MMLPEKMPKVSVCVITYNQDKYIRQCLQSIVDQVTDFDFEVIVGEDCSTDGTRAIVQEFAEGYPGIVKPIYQEKNIGGGCHNFLTVHNAAKGEFVAHIDGDDWVCPGKLIKQASYLDAHSECTLVAHRMSTWNAEKQVSTTRKNSQSISLSALLHYHPMFLHSSIMYRRDRLSDIFAGDLYFIDFYVYVTAALRGEIGFINEVFGNYRSNIGVSSKRNLMPYIQAAIDLAASNVGETSDVRRCRSRQYLSYAVAALLTGDLHDFNSKLALAKRFDDKRLLIHILYRIKDWPRLIRAIVVLYKRVKIWMRHVHRPISVSVALTECEVQERNDRKGDVVECNHVDKIS